jgi:hypothetical protein
MEFTAKLVQVLPLQTGQGKNGQWKKQDIIVETDGQYPKKICVAIWGDKIDISRYSMGTPLTISFDVESREFNGRWYTDVKAWKVVPAGGASEQPSSPQQGVDSMPPPFSPDNDDLPF